MRTSIRVGRGRGLAIAASVLLAGTALAAATIATQSAQAAAEIVTVTSPGPQTTTPLGSEVELPIAASDTDTAALPLTFAATALPAGLTPVAVDSHDAAIKG